MLFYKHKIEVDEQFMVPYIIYKWLMDVLRSLM